MTLRTIKGINWGQLILYMLYMIVDSPDRPTGCPVKSWTVFWTTILSF